MSVRRAQARDADRVLALMAALGRPAVGADAAPQRSVYLRHLADNDCAIFVAEDGGTLAGTVSLWFRPRLNWATPEAWVPDLFVDAAYRRHGHARGLLDACVAAARERGCHRLTLESGHQRAEAHRLYESYGFAHHARSYVFALR